ncbi:hypothetical protein L5515_014377 [Caenorhabditis briggsae]|uniref:Uncharacterized protein n=1 Tax=Caenorhabditis briggsae TaxID=6238 RepID=A0AAE9J6T6_CAEBR|nr:hypothetical protein L3Y34_018253 [Caenorhabditis briggsae]UMM18209.1 hypothetical protein L5515_014377 [Caenorhabditis briggsae]
MIWIKLFIFFLLAFHVVLSERRCAQCVAGKYLSQRSLMQDSEAGQSMGWVEEWKITDCARGVIRFIPCKSACINVRLFKIGAAENTLEGVMHDCADDMIHSSPDLPQDIDFKEYSENAEFSNRRRNFNITYSFTMANVDNKELIQNEYSSFIMPSYKSEYTWNSIIIQIAFPVIVVSLFVALCCCAMYKECGMCRKSRKPFDPDTGDDLPVEDLEMAPVVRSELE